MAGPKRKRAAATHTGGDSDAEGDRDGEFVAEDWYTEGGVSTEMTVTPAECPFTVEYRQAKKPLKGKKAKRHKTGPTSNTGPPPAQQLDQEPPEDTTVFTVKPKKQWDSLKKYRNFVVGNENFALNEYIFVSHSNTPTDVPELDEQKFWVARVLEIRAVDEAHVYLRVYWLYWPEELPGGRQPYHGQKELIASNHMEIVDAMTVSGRAHVKHWMELDEDEELPDLYWRQKFDFPTQTLMEVREHCKCHRYYNPDKLMYGCPHCKTWLHEECVQEDIKRKAYAKTLEEEGEEALKNALAAIDIDAPPPPPATTSKKKGKKGSTAAQNGKGKASLTKDVHNPTIEQLDKMFEVIITVNNGGQATRALIRDIRPKVGDEEGDAEEEADADAEAEDADGDGEKAEKAKRKKARREWEEDVLCLLCNKAIY
ncbi:hypothetical protein BDZ91DRAFT_720681 [Kalaharituber pfeilii]|nr:hypothetical protein BDZ91DRAFT_720681 [Kalaharituber pfeilii]